MKRTTRARIWAAADRMARYVDPIGAVLLAAALAAVLAFGPSILWR